MHDTDAAGILYFARIYRFVEDALEDMLSHEGIPLSHLFKTREFAFVIAHSEADYKIPLFIEDELEVEVTVYRIGTTSFTMSYKIFKTKPNRVLAGKVKTIHVAVNPKKQEKMKIPDAFKLILAKHHEPVHHHHS